MEHASDGVQQDTHLLLATLEPQKLRTTCILRGVKVLHLGYTLAA